MQGEGEQQRLQANIPFEKDPETCKRTPVLNNPPQAMDIKKKKKIPWTKKPVGGITVRFSGFQTPFQKCQYAGLMESGVKCFIRRKRHCKIQPVFSGRPFPFHSTHPYHKHVDPPLKPWSRGHTIRCNFTTNRALLLELHGHAKQQRRISTN